MSTTPVGLTQEGLAAFLEHTRAAYGDPQWWPADSAFEVMIGAILTQNTAWTNVEKAIGNLREQGLIDAIPMIEAPAAELATAIRPSGYYNVKTQRLRNLCIAYLEEGGFEGMAALPTETLRERLLRIQGVGRETADDILLYAFHRPIFVVDTYTRRIFSRIGWIEGNEAYDRVREDVEACLGDDPQVYNELHALIVMLGKEACRPNPQCPSCPAVGLCAYGQRAA